MDSRLTHVIVTDAGQWAKGKDEADAKEQFKHQHSGRSIKRAQVWAVTANTRITEMGMFAMPREEYCEPVRIK